ncbi:SDR family NAD(P)-dependent oxidoreductase [Pedobacter sp. SD-b]|uniref:SDR family NAD(P)-dependent oxidoreductase n=1 Tax=Pedobacter segetis TaxID=2793069 RepID=A0ABS1BNF9_9SPHI|nr:SDR family NAD(P)-dependent oxidoreductase [Pedobacter segetis]MBK0384437.1 SDR family NAD(P)-dependent oxidoreductase [Pedobacter segetis]
MSTSNKIVMITGATSGIGEACAEIYAANNFDLIITGRREEKLKSLRSKLEKRFGVNITTLCFDVSDSKQVASHLNQLPSRLKKVAVLINNAGLSLGLDPIQDGELTDWDTMIDTNIKGLLYVSKIVSNWMIEESKGHIINIGSIAGKQVYANGNVYNATKHAVDALNQAMRIDLLKFGIKVTAINPGAVETAFSEVRFHGDKEKAKKVYEGFEPLVAKDIAETIFFVTSRPDHVNINDLIIMPTAQASPYYLNKNSE